MEGSAAMATTAPNPPASNSPNSSLQRPSNAEPEKSFVCETCNRVFNKKANLKVHSRKHTGEKPYACSKPGCGRTFMWKSSVTFHEQNCQANKKDAASTSSSGSASASVSSKGVQKNHPKRGRQTAVPSATVAARAAALLAAGSASSSSKTRPSSASNAAASFVLQGATTTGKCAKSEDGVTAPSSHSSPVLASHASSLTAPIPTTPMSPEGSLTPASQSTVSNLAHDLSRVHAFGGDHTASVDAAAAQQAGAINMMWPVASSSAMSAPTSSSGSPSSLVSPPPPPSAFANASGGLPEGAQLPAPSTLLCSDKRMASSGGRPPVIPKHFCGLPPGHKDVGSGGPAKGGVFELRVPSGQGASGAKPPVMHAGKMPNMPKMPINMDLDDSDDEGTGKVVGAQDLFLRTGNPFSGFAPPTRCSPLPASSPIVCPGISPMPLSPLAPFSPLPPDSPAHNAPNPVHPPVNAHFNTRTLNTNW